MRDTILSLCDLTGHMTDPWVAAGYHAVLVDPQHPRGVSTVGQVTRIGAVIADALTLSYIRELVRQDRLAFVAGFPPCTDVAVSGARWWEEKRKKDPYFQAKAAIVAEQCRMIGELSGAPWFFENPVSGFSGIFGKPQHSFHPWEFNALCPGDNYTKNTCLWSGNGFVMPERQWATPLGLPDNRIHMAPPGEDRMNFRSATPMGFARAVFAANRV
jgi:hypothetical protein